MNSSCYHISDQYSLDTFVYDVFVRFPRILMAFFVVLLLNGCVVKPPPTKERVRLNFTGPVTRLAFSPDGSTLAVGTAGRIAAPGESWKGELYILDAKTYGELASFPQARRVNDITFSPDGKFLSIGTGCVYGTNIDGTQGYQPLPGCMIVYSTGDWKERFRFTGINESVIQSVHFSRTGDALYALTGKTAESIRGWQVPQFLSLPPVVKADRSIEAFCPTVKPGEFVLAGPGENKSEFGSKISLYNSSTAKLAVTETPIVKLYNVLDLHLSPCGKEVAICSGVGHGLSFFDISTRHFLERPNVSYLLANGYGNFAYSADGKFYARAGTLSGSSNYGFIGVWNAATLDRAYWEEPTVRNFCDVSFSPDGRTLVAGGTAGDRSRGVVFVWDFPPAKSFIENKPLP